MNQRLRPHVLTGMLALGVVGLSGCAVPGSPISGEAAS